MSHAGGSTTNPNSAAQSSSTDTRTPRRKARTIPAAQRATTDSLRQRLDAARDEITRLRADNATLREQLARSLGDQRLHR